MRKRLSIGLLSAGLVAAMLPGVAVAEDTWNSGQCVKDGFIDRAADPNAEPLPVGPWTYNTSHQWSPVDTPAAKDKDRGPWGDGWITNNCSVDSSSD